MRRKSGRKFLRMELDVSVGAGGEAFVDVARVLIEQSVAPNGLLVRELCVVVALDAVVAEPLSHLPASADERKGDARPVVLELDVRERVGGSLEVRGADVRDAVRRAQHLDL